MMIENFEEKYRDIYEKGYTIDDILKILSALTVRQMKEAETNHANIKKTIYGSGFEIEIVFKAKPDNE